MLTCSIYALCLLLSSCHKRDELNNGEQQLWGTWTITSTLNVVTINNQPAVYDSTIGANNEYIRFTSDGKLYTQRKILGQYELDTLDYRRNGNYIFTSEVGQDNFDGKYQILNLSASAMDLFSEDEETDSNHQTYHYQYWIHLRK